MGYRIHSTIKNQNLIVPFFDIYIKICKAYGKSLYDIKKAKYMTNIDITKNIVYRITQQLNSSLDLDVVFSNVLRLTMEATGAERGSIFLLDESGQIIRHILARPYQSPEVLHRNLRQVMSCGLAGWTYKHRIGTLVTNTTTDERWTQLDDDKELTGSALAVPMLYNEMVNGILTLHQKHINFFNDSHLTLVTGIAGQAALALENSRLYTQIKNDHESIYTIINSMPIPVILIDTDYFINFANHASQKLLLIKQEGASLCTIQNGKQLIFAMKQLINQPENHIKVNWHDGRVFNLSINEIPQHGTIVAMDDITYLIKLNDLKEQFLSTVSHELRTPLSVVLGFARVINKKLTKYVFPHVKTQDSTTQNVIMKVNKDFNLIELEGKRLAGLIDELLVMSKVEAVDSKNNMRPVSLTEIISRSMAVINGVSEQNKLELRKDIDGQLPMVVGNQDRLIQVLVNLLSNAVKFTKEGSVTCRAWLLNNEIVTSVIDTGIGIAKDDQEMVFEKFWQVDDSISSKTKGTGLGLSICKQIVEQHGGKIWVESEPGKGSIFSFSLPCNSQR